jgi:carboxymethylenebutenolidase
MALDDYLVSEVRLDHSDGHITRREALRLLGLLGVASSTAAMWLDTDAAAAASRTTKKTTKKKTTKKSTTSTVAATSTPTSTGASGTMGSVVPNPQAVVARPIRFAGPAGELRASFCAAVAPRGGVLIIHENRGLTKHFQDLPTRFARSGYNALAIDLASRAGGTDAVASQMPAPLANLSTSELVADMTAGLDQLERLTPGKKLAIIGFCFGGGMVWNMVNAGDPRLAAAVPFYGVGPEGADFSRSKAAVLAIYAELDARVNANRPAMTAALEAAKLTHKILAVPGVDHAFFNDTGPRYDPKQTAAVYTTLLEWFDTYLR